MLWVTVIARACTFRPAGAAGTCVGVGAAARPCRALFRAGRAGGGRSKAPLPALHARRMLAAGSLLADARASATATAVLEAFPKRAGPGACQAARAARRASGTPLASDPGRRRRFDGRAGGCKRQRMGQVGRTEHRRASCWPKQASNLSSAAHLRSSAPRTRPRAAGRGGQPGDLRLVPRPAFDPARPSQHLPARTPSTTPAAIQTPTAPYEPIPSPRPARPQHLPEPSSERMQPTTTRTAPCPAPAD